MNKCFIEYPNHNLYICYDDVLFCYINLMLDKQDSMYHFIQFVYQTKHMLYDIKQVNKFKSKNSKLHKLVYECIDVILTDIMHDAFEYVTIPHVLKDNKCLDVYICCSNNYRDTFADNISIDRLITKIPLLFSAF